LISSISLRQQRPSVAARLWTGCRADASAYLHGLRHDLGGLAADTAAWYLAVTVLVSQLVDALSTILALANNWPEANPVSAAVIAQWGVAGLLIQKLVIVAVVVVNMARLRGRGAKALGFAAVLIGFAAAAWNIHLLG
jgi:hypothetical protein